MIRVTWGIVRHSSDAARGQNKPWQLAFWYEMHANKSLDLEKTFPDIQELSHCSSQLSLKGTSGSPRPLDAHVSYMF